MNDYVPATRLYELGPFTYANFIHASYLFRCLQTGEQVFIVINFLHYCFYHIRPSHEWVYGTGMKCDCMMHAMESMEFV